ncbi:MAG: helicase-related protein, partial [Planctomycetota bacterium]|nr:helicase-related protein [Planctomycetota bacterium]
SEVGSEGLDFQFCHVLVNWDLPWNPMVVEQRIGRLDRLGQRAEKILIFSFACPGTIEDVILQRLYGRIGVFERTIGVLEPILGQEIRELTQQLFRSKLTAAEREAMVEQRAIALAQKARNEELLESKAANLIGQDEFFNEQIARVKRLGRFVTGEELRLMVTEFLQSDFPGNALQAVTEPGVLGSTAVGGGLWRMRVSPDLREFVCKPFARNDPTVLRFVERSQNGRLIVTFDNEVAIRNPAVELIGATHPLIRAVAKHYDENPTRVHPVTAVQLRSSVVPAGVYLFLWVRVEESGIKGGHSLWAIAVSAQSANAVDPDVAEAMLHQMVISGECWREFETPPNAITEALLARAVESLVERYQTYRDDRKKHNASLVHRRLSSLEASYRIKLADREQRLESTRQGGKERGVALFEAQLNKLRSDYEERCRQVKLAIEVSVEWAIEGGGYVNVVE